MVEIVPLFTIETTVEHVKGMRPYTPLELAGRDIYVREGCYLCHSQLIRALQDEVERYGHYTWPPRACTTIRSSGARKRIGPDLARVGGKYSNDWHYAHLTNPQALVPESADAALRVPGRATRCATTDIEDSLRAQRIVGVPYTDEDIANAQADLAAQADRAGRAAGARKRYPKAVLVPATARRDRNGRAGRLSAGARHDGRLRRPHQRKAAAIGARMFMASSCGCATHCIVFGVWSSCC